VRFQLNLEQLRKQAKERVRERCAAGQDVTLADVQFELARELGFAGWPKLKSYVERLSLEQPFRVDLDYYEGRANGIASVRGVSVADARGDSQRGTASRAGASFAARVAIICFPRSLICHPPDGNSKSLLTVYVIAPCSREICADIAVVCC